MRRLAQSARPTLAAAPTLALLLASCAAEAPRSPRLDAIRLTLEPTLRIGSVDDPGTSFTWFRHLVVGPDGRIFTMHDDEALIRVHAADGRLLGTIGGRGKGPGEFDSLGRMGLLGDTLWVLDFGTYRFSFFDLDGRLLGTKAVPFRLGSTPDENPPRPRGILPDGTITASPPAWSQEVAAGKITEQVVLRVDDAGGVVDTVVRYSLVNSVLEVTDPDDPRSVRSYRSQPFGDNELVEISATEPVIVRVERPAATGPEQASFRVTRWTLSGDTIFSREYAYTPAPLDPARVDSLARYFGERMSKVSFPNAPTAAQATKWARDAMIVPAFHPPVTGVVLGRDGTTWLQRDLMDGDVVDWMILDPAGAPLGTVAVPRRLTVLAAERGTVWGMQRDALDVPYIVRYAVGPAGGGEAL